MNPDSVRRGAFMDENLHLSPGIPDLGENSNGDGKAKNKRGVEVIKVKSKGKITMGPGATYEQCFSGSNFSSQYEDECPVNYSLKYSETEPCKTVNKCEVEKKKFKDYSDYAETDLDQPTDFSLKYAEKNYEDESKNNEFNYFTSHKAKLKEYTDYVETDLDQPTDFTLKYRESAEEDVKSVDFGFYGNEDRKPPGGFGLRRIRGEQPEEVPCERLPERYASQNETPLMFSRSSSMNSLSSFVHITQSIPDDRSSIVSDFSRMTSGIISPSELPDSPTQTAPSSPKRHKPPGGFPAKPDFLNKQSVFEDDVATYKQEDTPIEFSRATSLSSLNLDNPVKSELAMKRNPTSLLPPREENRNPVDQTEYLKQQMAPEKAESEKGKFELASVLEVDESLCADCISIDIQINCRKPKPNYGRMVVGQEGNAQLRQTPGFPLKPNLRLRFNNEGRKNYSGYDGSDDAIHTYHTEGTPANVSHAGSHSDLSALSIASGVPFSGADDNSDNESLFREIAGRGPPVKSQLEYLRKDHQLTAKDETATFATENSPCDFSIRSSFNDLTVNVMDPPLSINRASTCEEPPSQMLSPLHNVSPQSPNSMVFEEAEDGVLEKCSEETQDEFVSTVAINQTRDEWDQPDSRAEEKTEGNLEKESSCCVEFDSNQPLTPFEEALLEECIRLGMPPKKNQKQCQETHFNKLNEEGKSSQERNQEEFLFSRSNKNESGYLSEKTNSEGETHPSRQGKDALSVLNSENFDFDSSEPLTPFEEVLLEQCIRLGMPQKRTCHEEKLEEKETENFDCDSAELITPLETALLEQCIRLGMPQKKNNNNNNQRKGDGTDEPQKTVTCLTSHLNRLKLSGENEKDGAKKCENCPCGKKHNNRRRGGVVCRRSKNRLDNLKVESCPV